jgi:hypothetical protein
VVDVMCVNFTRDNLAAYFVSCGCNMLVSDGYTRGSADVLLILLESGQFQGGNDGNSTIECGDTCNSDREGAM